MPSLKATALVFGKTFVNYTDNTLTFIYVDLLIYEQAADSQFDANDELKCEVSENCLWSSYQVKKCYKSFKVQSKYKIFLIRLVSKYLDVGIMNVVHLKLRLKSSTMHSLKSCFFFPSYNSLLLKCLGSDCFIPAESSIPV